jgi:hypothetical protein
MKFKYLLLSCVVFAGLNSCKKDTTPAPTTSSLLLGKWYTAKIVSHLFTTAGQSISTDTTAKFTTNDFVEYYQDGSGYYSETTASGISLDQFKYTLNGSVITAFYNAETNGAPETITGISVTSLVIHTITPVPDPNDPEATDTQIADYSYSR